ncbi:AraC family transcriptional regulator [Lachnotalea glycerini]|uniref:AraC family transcriptional regulator n=1 Tax=Lachnotalea glycerini TaxID=1763509 RepID=A0A255ICL3_9FIRM|nr:AraC family transcriptional regulator [Lachnotalea glycerini]PXV90268.1 AraC family transcriptional regulator [Lachnotalea glycerini]RDY31022.1 AraC family transcriptional regulator [Lachnotalea glycerini]
MKKVPFLFELIVLLVLLLVIPTSIVTYYSSKSMLKYSEEEIAESAMARLESNSDLIELVLNNTVRNVLQIVKGSTFNTLRDANTYTILNHDYDNISKAFVIVDALNEIVNNNTAVHSAFFYLDDADYLVSTDKGIVRLDSYESIDWLTKAQEQMSGPSGLWYPRILTSQSVKDTENGDMQEMEVISYVYRLSKLVTATKGTIVINVSEDEICKYLNSSRFGTEMDGMLIDKNGIVISDVDKSKLFKELEDEAHIKDMLNSGNNSGFEYVSNSKEKMLYTYYRTSFNDWTYVAKYPMAKLMAKSYNMRTRYTLLTIIIIIVGTMLAIFAASRFSKPMRQLIKDLKSREGVEYNRSKNDLTFIANAFSQIQKQEENLHKLLKEREEETKNLALNNLMMGEITNETELNEIKKLFPYNHYIVALASVDNMKAYLHETNHDIRSYQRYVLFEKIERSFPDGYKVSCVRYIGGMLGIIINMKEYDHSKVPRTIGNVLTILKNEAAQVMGYTITIGVSAVHNNYEGIKDCTSEASEAVKSRLVEGRNSIIFWKSKNNEKIKYHYSYNSEKKILNYLNTGDKNSIEQELKMMINEIKSFPNVSNDNIVFIFNQLAGATVKYMAEHNMNTNRLVGHNSNIYSNIAEFDTLEEIEAYLNDLYRAIIESSSQDHDMNEVRYWEQIMKYINKHYKEEIVFEELAEKIGISYSYLRKLVKEETGKSLMDNVNLLRIEEVKRLLLHSNLNISQIAIEVGYRNVQSVNRFFKKYEGVSPSDFKNNQ